MKKHILTLAILLFVTLFFEIGDLKCQEKAQVLNSQYNSEYVKRSPETKTEDDIDAKNIGVRMLEVSLKQHITKRYQKLYTEELENRLENGID